MNIWTMNVMKFSWGYPILCLIEIYIYIYIYIFTINNTNNNIINITKKWHFQGLQGILFKKFK